MPIAIIYTSMIMSGDKKFSDVMPMEQPEVKRQLELLGYGHLAE